MDLMHSQHNHYATDARDPNGFVITFPRASPSLAIKPPHCNVGFWPDVSSNDSTLVTRRIASTILDFAECRYSRITDPPFLLSTPPSTHSLLLSEARMAPMIQACNGGRRRSTAYPDLLHGKKNQTNPQESVQTRSRLVWGYRLRHLPRGVWVCFGCGVSVRWHRILH